jgi:antitoxin (DNA-binding transcriptional repressor) of toxin-antitoxin stability system
MEAHITDAEAARTFPEVVDRVRSHGDVFVVERAGQALCRIVPVSSPRRTVRDLVRLLESMPRPDDAYLDAVEDIVKNQPTLPVTPWER